MLRKGRHSNWFPKKSGVQSEGEVRKGRPFFVAHAELLLAVEPFAYVIRDHICHDSNYESNKNIHLIPLPSFLSRGVTRNFILPQMPLFVNCSDKI